MLAAASGLADDTRYGYDAPNDRRFVTNTNVLERWSPAGTNNRSHKVTSGRARAEAAFTALPVAVDGVREAAWDAATPVAVASTFDATMTAASPGAWMRGTARFLWDGPVLYVLVEVEGDSTPADSSIPDWSTPSYAPDGDGIF